MNPPSDREYGELLGEIRAIRRQVSDSQRSTREQISDLQRTNSAEHAANAERMERIEAKIEAGLKEKADVSTVRRLAEKVEDLGLADAGAKGRDAVLKGGFGALVTLAAVLLGDHLHL